MARQCGVGHDRLKTCHMEIQMKVAALAVLVTVMALAPEIAAAKSVKWACVALNPLSPSSYTCFAVSRP